MSESGNPQPRWSDQEIDQVIGRLLQIGVLLAAVVVLVGGVLLLKQHGGTSVSFATFRGEPDTLSSLMGVWRGVLALNSRAIVQFGLLLLIATPIARVALTLGAFVILRDKTYVVVTTIVLVLLLYGILYGKA
ncbi:MAG TPA: DUF1634 domain-containing protein [Gemmatimonadaceae bacterium]|nr:DUF1634 domain-containing protein [Gemmatimonadaceae bacterium]